MTRVVLFHSVYGRRPAVLAAADRLRAAGHTVTAPDLYAGRLAPTAEAGFALCDQIGWQTIMRRARLALTGWPPETVLAGLSMGASVAASLLDERPATAGVCAVRGDHHGNELLVQCVSVSMSLIWYTCRGGVANVA